MHEFMKDADQNISNKVLLEKLLLIQHRAGNEMREILTELSDILREAYERDLIPPARFATMCFILLGQETGLQFVKETLPTAEYEEIFAESLPTVLQ